MSTIDSLDDVTTEAPGNARPNSSAVRRAPTTTARTASEPQRAHRNAASARPHHRHTTAPRDRPASGTAGDGPDREADGGAAGGAVKDSGPVQCRQRAIVRH